MSYNPELANSLLTLALGILPIALVRLRFPANKKLNFSVEDEREIGIRKMKLKMSRLWQEYIVKNNHQQIIEVVSIDPDTKESTALFSFLVKDKRKAVLSNLTTDPHHGEIYDENGTLIAEVNAENPTKTVEIKGVKIESTFSE